ncbi:hypothetical protein [Thalassospira mesophila]|uniref:Uncharacterized protein n=1 Tax=Thalassospira mesophila TaxID=1293891 RepID=A0A1Y2KXP1_9PROT|nr:hypothetical protein [Thalassospira mesophila]OSQ37183.1 hypothetical protein TMES_15295 [Thalassospira mesophila]
MLAACSLPGAGVNADGGLKLLYAPFALENNKLPEYWLYVTPQGDTVPANLPQNQESAQDRAPSSSARPALFWEDVDGKVALGIAAYGTQNDAVELGRRTNIAILSTPFLSFDWQLQNGALPGDATLILGFRNQNADSWIETDFGVGLPGVDYVLQIPVGGTPDALPTATQPNTPAPAPTFWQTDYLDLATLHRRYWPKADPAGVKLVWIGVASRPQHTRAPGAVTYLSHILLSR